MPELSKVTRARLAELARRDDVLGAILVGSNARGHHDKLSDDDLEIFLTGESFCRLSPTECLEHRFEGEGAARLLAFDAQYLPLSHLLDKARSEKDFDHWPYEKAVVLFDREDQVREAVEAAARMSPEFRAARLRNASLDAWVAIRRGRKTQRRSHEAALRLLVVRGLRTLARVLFGLEWRWVPLDHWFEHEIRTLRDPAGAVPPLLECIHSLALEDLQASLDLVDPILAQQGVPTGDQRRELFARLIHPDHATERRVHALP